MRAAAPGNIRAIAGCDAFCASGWYPRQDDLIGYRAID
jgi:hypothetical protein